MHHDAPPWAGLLLQPVRRGFCLVLLALCAGLAAAAEPAAKAEPAATAEPAEAGEPAGASAAIDTLHAELLDVMKQAETLGYEGRERRFAKVIPRFFDTAFMARKSLGRYWPDDPAAQQRFLETFERFMVANYAGRFDGFSGQSFETLGQEPAPLDTVVVKSQLIDPTDENVELNYRMRRASDGAWKIIDVYLDGTVSELALRRSEFTSIMKREDLDALLVALDAKIQKLAGGEES